MLGSNMKFSVLMSLYYKESPYYFEECLVSIYNQTVPVTELVIVEDGPLTDELYSILKEWGDKLNLIRVRLEQNVGLGQALNYGLKHCTNEIVARMDTDDVCLPHRFERQLAVMKRGQVDVCGSSVSEFESRQDNTTAYRLTFENNKDIILFIDDGSISI